MIDLAGPARHSIQRLLRELLDGPTERAGLVLNPGDRGLLASLDGISAAAASARPGGRSSIAAHVDHLRYGLELLNRWARGEPDPWADALFAASWRRQHVDDDGWRALRAALAAEARAWCETSGPPGEWDEESLAIAISSVVHLAYHAGAIRQIDAAARGPVATD